MQYFHVGSARAPDRDKPSAATTFTRLHSRSGGFPRAQEAAYVRAELSLSLYVAPSPSHLVTACRLTLSIQCLFALSHAARTRS